MHAVQALRVVARVEPLELPPKRIHGAAVEQLAELRVAKQLAQLRVAKQLAQLSLVHGQRLRAAFGERRVAVVQETCDVAEEQRGGKRRWHF